MFLIDYAVDRAGKDPYLLKPTAIHDVMSRIITMRRSLGIRGLFRVRPHDMPENNQWDQFVSKEASLNNQGISKHGRSYSMGKHVETQRRRPRRVRT